MNQSTDSPTGMTSQQLNLLMNRIGPTVLDNSFDKTNTMKLIPCGERFYTQMMDIDIVDRERVKLYIATLSWYQYK